MFNFNDIIEDIKYETQFNKKLSMLGISRECFVFNAIENDIADINGSNITNITNILLMNSINENNIQQVVNKVAPKFNISIKTTDTYIEITIYYNKGFFSIIKLICSNNIVDVYLKDFSGSDNPLLVECTIQILNYLKEVGLNISDIINYDTWYVDTLYGDKCFYLSPNNVRQLLIFIKNNYKIKIVCLKLGLNVDNIEKIELCINEEQREIEDILKDNIINIKKNTEIKVRNLM